MNRPISPPTGEPNSTSRRDRVSELDQERSAAQVLDEVLDNIGEGFALFDADERLVAVNDRLRSWLPEIRDILVPGARFEDLLRAAAESRSFKLEGRDLEDWVEKRLQQFRNPGPPSEHQFKDGRWLLISDVRTASGGYAGLRTDITDLKRREQALQESEVRYRALAEESMQGILIHRAFEPLYANARFAEIFGYQIDEIMDMSALYTLFTSDPRERAGAFNDNAYDGQGKEGFIAFSAHRLDGGVVHLEGLEREVTWMGEPATQLTLYDVTSRATSDAHRKTMLDVISAVTEARDFKQALKSAVTAVCKNLGWAYAAAWVPTPDGEALRLEAIWHLGTPSLDAFEAMNRKRLLGPGEGLAGEAWATRRPQSADAVYASHAIDHGLNNGIAAPVIIDDEVLAVLTFWTEGTRYADTALIEIIIAVANEVGSVFRRKRSEEALQESEARFRNLIEGSFQGVVILDADSQPLFVNAAATRIFGYVSVEQMMTRQAIRSAIAPHERDRLADYRRRRIEGRDAPDFYEFEGVRADGKQIWLQCLVRTVLWDNEPALQATLLDVTARREAEAESRMLLEQIERTRRMEALGTLAGGVAHDINNALVPILGLGELIAEELRDDESNYDCMQSIIDAAEHIRKLTEQILAFSRSESGALEQVDFAGIVREALTLLGRSLPATVSIVSHIDKTLAPINGDATKLMQVFMNLVTNAAHAIGGAPGNIVITYVGAKTLPPGLELPSSPAGWARLTVIDSGPGIPEDCIERVFEPFFTTKPVGEGTGLGLSVVHGIVSAHGGHIEALNTPGSGACFHVLLPLAASGEDTPDQTRPTGDHHANRADN